LPSFKIIPRVHDALETTEETEAAPAACNEGVKTRGNEKPNPQLYANDVADSAISKGSLCVE
jgi:hypothetical protein